MIYKYKGKVVVADSMKEACNILSISKEELMREGKEVSFTLKGVENEPEAKTGRGYTQRVNEWAKDNGVDKNAYQKYLVAKLKEHGCCICGYGQCYRALVFHHVEPELKRFEIRVGRVRIKGLEEELAKCMLLCLNCHAMIHGIYENPKKGRKDVEKFVEMNIK
jgi:hypothetical protein